MLLREEKDDMVTLGFRVSAETKEQVIEISRQHQCSLSVVFRSLIQAGLETIDRQ